MTFKNLYLKNYITVDGVTGITGEINLKSGLYEFYAQITDSGNTQRGYPVSFRVLDNPRSKIVDNDSRILPYSVVPYRSTEFKFHDGNDRHNYRKQHGYYLSSKLVKGSSGAWAQWRPFLSVGRYEIYVHIPPLANSKERYGTVSYRIYPQGEGGARIDTTNVNQNSIAGQWIRLESSDGEFEFDFTDKGYVGLSLSRDDNPGATIDEWVVLDAVEFRVGNNVPEPASTLRVVIEPAEAHTAGARWQLVGTSEWHASEHIENLAPAQYEIAFNILPGWNTEPNQTAPVQANQTTTITATYTPNNTSYRINAAAGANGSVRGEGQFVHNTLVTLTAVPNRGYNFSHWSENGQIVSGVGATYSFRSTAARNLTAHFREISGLPGVMMLLLDD